VEWDLQYSSYGFMQKLKQKNGENTMTIKTDVVRILRANRGLQMHQNRVYQNLCEKYRSTGQTWKGNEVREITVFRTLRKLAEAGEIKSDKKGHFWVGHISDANPKVTLRDFL